MRRADDLLEVLRLGQLTTQRLVLNKQLAKFKDAFQLIQHIVKNDRFDQVIKCPRFEGLDGVLDRGIGRDDQAEHRRVDPLQLPQQCHPVPIGQLDVADGDMEVLLLSCLQTFGHVPSFGDFESFPGQELGQRVTDDWLIFYDEYGPAFQSVCHDKPFPVCRDQYAVENGF